MAERNIDFDNITDRRNTRSLKYDFTKEYGMPGDVLPLWVADMDFKTSSYVQDALVRQAGHGIFGYSRERGTYTGAVRRWHKKYYNRVILPEWIVVTPGVMFAVAAAVNAFTDKNDAVIIQQPVYYPFRDVVVNNGRRLVVNELYLGGDNRFHIDYDDFEKKIVNENVKLFILCNPHNPVARSWTEDELLRLGDICLKYGVKVISDEIHADFVFKGVHTVFAGIKEEYEHITVTCTSPSKTFNIAGLQISNIIIADEDMRRRFVKCFRATGYCEPNSMALAACEAAYLYGDEWYEALRAYIRKNVEYAGQFISGNIPGVTVTEHEATYLVWVNFRELGLSDEAIDDMIINRAGLWLDPGLMFGSGGGGFQRINAACPAAVLETALDKLKKAFTHI
ncbi:MAG: pyridoxal phosphate-dependent aminotransferase [Lachnospiraceae bacterium]|nr:pyridoxal phosphate-dependent aminotransferase [Lachnospiraceae bacterium]